MQNSNRKISARKALQIWVALGLSVLSMAGHSKATPTLEPNQSVYLGLLPGSQFSVLLNVNNPDPSNVVAYDFFVTASDESIFAIVAQILDEPVDQSNAPPLPFSVKTSDTENDFGAFNFASTEGFGQGTSLAQTLVFAISPAAPQGSYTLSFGWNFPSLTGGPYLVDADINQHQMASPLVITISVVPEPTATSLLLAFGVILLLLGKNLSGPFSKLD